MMKKKLIITGGDGFFASRFIEYYKDQFEIYAFSHKELDITNENQTRSVIDAHKPDYLVHAAAISDTGRCEREPELSYEVNVKGSLNVAKGCMETGAKLIYLSSDQVYSGNVENGPYSEALAVPNTVYGRHKLQAEESIARVAEEYVILRLTWMFGLPEKGKKINSNILWNSVKAIINREKIGFPSNDYRGITYVHELIANFSKILELQNGVYNAGSENNLSSYEVAEFMFGKLLGGSYGKELLEQRDRGKSRDLRINGRKLRENGIIFGETIEGIKRCIKHFSLDRI